MLAGADRPPLRDAARVDAGAAGERRALAGCSRSRPPSSRSATARPSPCSRLLRPAQPAWDVPVPGVHGALPRRRRRHGRGPEHGRRQRAIAVVSGTLRRPRPTQPRAGRRGRRRHGRVRRATAPSAPARSTSPPRCRRSRPARSTSLRLLGRRGERRARGRTARPSTSTTSSARGTARSRGRRARRRRRSASRRSSRTIDSLGGTSDAGHRVWDMHLGWVPVARDRRLRARPARRGAGHRHALRQPGRRSGSAPSRCETPLVGPKVRSTRRRGRSPLVRRFATTGSVARSSRRPRRSRTSPTGGPPRTGRVTTSGCSSRRSRTTRATSATRSTSGSSTGSSTSTASSPPPGDDPLWMQTFARRSAISTSSSTRRIARTGSGSARQDVETRWRFTSERPAGDHETLPLINVDYDLSLSSLNTAPPGPFSFGVRFRLAPGATPSPITSVVRGSLLERRHHLVTCSHTLQARRVHRPDPQSRLGLRLPAGDRDRRRRPLGRPDGRRCLRRREMNEPGRNRGCRRWAILDSNQGPPPYQSGALTN